jgi:hypothetical protein
VDTRSQVLIILFLVLLVVTSIWKYDTFFVNRDYSIYTLVSCDPEEESCFSFVCEEGDEECDDSPYKKIEMLAADAPLCDPYTDETCDEPSCNAENGTCIVTVCSEDALEEGEMCAITSPDELDGETDEEEGALDEDESMEVTESE